MHRERILIEKRQYDILKARSARSGRSVSSLVKEILEKELVRKPMRKRKIGLESICGIIDDPNIRAEDIDRVVYGIGKDGRK